MFWLWQFRKIFLPPANEVCEGCVFTGVCLSTGGCLPLVLGGCLPLVLGGGLPLVLGGVSGQTPPTPRQTSSLGRHPPPAQCMLGCTPPADTTGYGQQADGTHPTGMHSCFTFAFFINSDKIGRPVFQGENILLIAFAILLSLACSSLSIVFNNFSTAVLFASNL